MKKDIKLCKLLIDKAINETISLWADNPEAQSNFAWGYREIDDRHIIVGANHGYTFHFLREVVLICEATDMNYYPTITEDEDGLPTAGLHIY